MSFNLLRSSNFVTIFIRIFVMFSGIISSIITAHSLGPKGRGELISLTTFCLTIANFSNLGFPSSNTYYISSKSDLLSPIFFNSFYISVFGAGLGIIVAFIYYDISDEYFYFKILYIFFYIFTIMFSNFCSNILISLDSISKFNMLDLLQNSLILVLYCTCFIFKLPIYYYLLFTLTGTTFGVFFGYFNIKDKIFGNLQFSLTLFKSSFNFAFKVFITTFIAFFIAKGNIFLLSKTKSAQEVGIFSIALQLYEAISIIPSAIGLLLFPFLIKSERRERFHNMKKILKQIGLLMFLLCGVAFFSIPILIPMIFGDDFIPSVAIAQLLLPGAFFLGIMSVVSQYLASCGYPKVQVIIWVIALIFWIFSSLVFVPLYGSQGVAFILSTTNCLIFLMLYALSLKLKKDAESK